MKRLMAILAAISLVVPFTNVLAEGEVITDCSVNSSCFVYKPGDEVNFYRSEKERELHNTTAGQTTIVLEDAGANSKYVKVLAIAPYGTQTPYFDEKTEKVPTQEVKKEHISSINKESDFPWESAKAGADNNIEMSYITLDELIKVFGAAKQADGTYTIDATKWGDKFILAAVGSRASKGFYTGSYDLTTKKVWAVEYTLNDTEDKITAITVKQVAMNTNTYGYLPVVSFDKTYDCHARNEQDQNEMACYSCDNDYKWLQIGTQAATCTLVPDAKSKGTCVKAVKTGVEDYILEFAGIALICGIALVVAKKKDLFRSI